MPKNMHHNAIARLLEILKRLPTKGPGVTARDLTGWLDGEGYPVSKRTVERDLNELSCHFPLTRNDKGTPAGWRWMEGDGPDLPSVTMAEALSLTLLEDLLRPLLPGSVLESLEPRFKQARRKLGALAETNPKARWADKVRYVPPALPLLPPKITAGVLETVQEALLADRQLSVVYKRLDAYEPQDLLLHPLGLVQRGPVSYLVATVFDYSDSRIFAVHRILEAKRLNELSKTPEEFNLDDYIRHGALHFGDGKSITFSAMVSEWLAAILEETPISSNQRMEKSEEGCRITATVNDTWQLRWWILSYGDGITILSPAELRREIAATLKRCARNYSIKAKFDVRCS